MGKGLYYIGVAGLVLFEILNVYFIMPMPGISQEINSLGLAYFLYRWRWILRAFFLALILLNFRNAIRASRWLSIISMLVLLVIAYMVNFRMSADHMFEQPQQLQMKGGRDNKVPLDRIVIGISYQGEARAYPIQYIGYHHQVRDSVGGKPVMVTYCTVCRTGRVFEPLVNGSPEVFRLVGMDHYNAMFEDQTTGSWWRQATGEAVTGALKGQRLPEFPSMQTTLDKWMEQHPHTLVMQPDARYAVKYDSMRTYERGKLVGRLTRRDTSSWQEKSWVIGVQNGVASKAYDWNQLTREKILHDEIMGKPLVLVLSADSASFIVLERQTKDQYFTLRNDTLLSASGRYSWFGKAIDSGRADLKRIPAYQEYWHSWKTFHPGTTAAR